MNFLRGEHKFCSFELWTDLPLGYITQREERLREIVNIPESQPEHKMTKMLWLMFLVS